MKDNVVNIDAKTEEKSSIKMYAFTRVIVCDLTDSGKPENQQLF